ncbi:MAG: hypothetical protein LBM74_10430 [Oscillospiraceae bacterium]|nr:hypothetical protein [Oscillospiraceae bacterium]
MPNIIFIEGVSGAGKSTAAKDLAQKLCAMGLRACCFLEGAANNPIDFCFTAYLSCGAYDALMRQYEASADAIKAHTVMAGDVRLVRYCDEHKAPLFPEPLLGELQAHEFCWNPTEWIPFTEYRRVMETVWRAFAQQADALPDYIIFDGALLYHPINDMLHNYNAPLEAMVAHINKLLGEIRALRPMIFYLNPASIRDSLRHARKTRGDRPVTEAEISRWEDLNHMYQTVMTTLSTPSYVVHIPLGGWETAFQTMLQAGMRHECSE